MESLKRELGKIDNRFNAVALDYKRKIVGHYCSDIDMLTSSLIYRKGALKFHLDLIQNHLDYFSEYLSQPDALSKGSHLSFFEGKKMNYLFDDIIFNLVSFYDYFATFGAYIFYGEIIRSNAKGYDPLSIKNKKMDHLIEALSKISWKKFTNLANENPDRKSHLKYDPQMLQSSSFSKQVVKWNREFIYELIELRHDIIHNKIAPVSNKFSYDFSGFGKYEFEVHGLFTKKFPDADNSYEGALSFLIKNFTDSLLNFCNSLKKDIEDNRTVKKGEEFIKYKWEIEEET